MIRTIENHEDTRQHLQDIIESNDWWVLVDNGRSELPRIICERHYANGASADFRMLLGPDLAYQPSAFFVMRKSRMSAEDLSDCVRAAGGELLPAGVYEKRPFHFSPKGSCPTAVVVAFYDWIRRP